MPKKILVVVSSLNVGGTENHILQVFSRLNDDQHRVIVYTTHQPGVLAARLKSQGVKIRSSRLAAWLHRFGKFGRLSAYAVSVSRLTLLNLLWRPDVVHCYLPGPYILGGFCARLTRRPYLLMSRRSMNYYQAKFPNLARLEKRLYKHTARILANSKKVFDQLFHDEQVKEDKLRLIYNGLDLHRYRKQINVEGLRRSLGISDSSFVMVIVANLYAYKGHIDLLKALAEIKQELPSDWHLLCVGRDEGCLHRLQQFAKEHELTSHIHWLDQRDDVPALLSLADLGLLCSHEEGFSNSVIEGMALGLPMIVTDVGGNAEAVRHEKDGLVVPAKNPQALAAAIATLANNPLKREAMGVAAKQRVNDEFSLERCVNAYRELYAELD